jgi:hypothetical protein
MAHDDEKIMAFFREYAKTYERANWFSEQEQLALGKEAIEIQKKSRGNFARILDSLIFERSITEGKSGPSTPHTD